MPRKKQKSGPPPRPHRPSGPAKSGPAPASQAKGKGPKSDPGSAGAVKQDSQKKQSLQANQRPIVPFLRGDRILLVGEGKPFFYHFGLPWDVVLYVWRITIISRQPIWASGYCNVPWLFFGLYMGSGARYETWKRMIHACILLLYS